jgi:hypothetical protein
MPTPLAATQFIEILTASTPRLRTATGGQVASVSRQQYQAQPQYQQPQPAIEPQQAEVQTYAIDPVIGGSGGDETTF